MRARGSDPDRVPGTDGRTDLNNGTEESTCPETMTRGMEEGKGVLVTDGWSAAAV